MDIWVIIAAFSIPSAITGFGFRHIHTCYNGTTTAGTGTYTTQTGKYHKVGKLVYFTLGLDWTAHTGTGAIRIGGLPYTSDGYHGCSVGLSNNISVNAGAVIKAYVIDASTTIIITQCVSSGAGINIPMDTSGTLIISGTYLTS